ncbi:MAG: sugar transferase [Candidatus Omnitrophica bacterium]|nr:sugar transferase [Candidatus Omnitrophota bacterium]MDD5553444.1 sugar transferase [Candidatus Omnitrophota bacterium]
MLKEHAKFFTKISMSVDVLAVAGSYLVLFLLTPNAVRGSSLLNNIQVISVYTAIWSLLLSYSGMYTSFRTKDITDVLYHIFKSAFLGLVFFSALAYLTKEKNVDRAFMAWVFVSTAITLSLEKIAILWILRSYRKKGFNYRSLLIVGRNDRAARLIRLINEHTEWGFKIIGIIDDDRDKLGKEFLGFKIIGTLNDAARVIHDNIVDQVIFVVPRSWLNKIQDILYLCETEGVETSLALDFFDFTLARVKQTDLQGFPLLTFETTPDKLWHLVIKRAVDIAISSAAMVLLLPVFIIAAISIKLTSRGPVFFKQLRVSVNGRIFYLYKFRTMVEDAEKKLQELMAKNEMRGPVFKISNDPRVTPAGKILRKLSIDELPQLWNVLKGNMSLVGPRPPIPDEVKKYDNWHRRRLSMRPGITCLWQVNGRNKISDFDEWTKLDLEYIDKWSLALDFKILFKTIPVVLFGIGAK